MEKENYRFSLLKTGYDAPVGKVADVPSPMLHDVTWRFWTIWVLVAVVALLIQFLTLDVLPHLQQDEAQITDYGRLTLHPHSDWSITWWIAEGKPLLIWSYLGPLIAEGSFQLGGASGLGPRLASLIGGFIAASMALGWLLARRVPVYAAFGMSFAFLLDPLFVLSQRMARVDCWVIALCLACCWLLRQAKLKEDNSFERGRVLAAGGLAATAAFIWPSAVFLYPLILLELFHMAKAEKAGAFRIRNIALPVLYFGVGGLVVAILLLIPIWQNLVIIFNDMTTVVATNVDSSKTLSERLFSLFNIDHWKTLMRSFRRTFSPVFPLLAIAGALLHREKGLILVLIVAIFIMFASLVYQLRVLYLLPYLLALSSGLFIQSTVNSSNLLLKRLRVFALSVLLIWAVGISLIIRTALGLEGKAERDRNKIYQVAFSNIGPGNHDVFLAFAYEFYFVGRALGWDLYTPYMQFSFSDQGNWTRENAYKPTHKLLELLSKVDYVIIPKGTATEKVDEQVAKANEGFEAQLARSGFYYSSTFQVGEQGYQNSTKDFLLWLLQGRIGLLQGKDSYGTYVVYARDKVGKIEKAYSRYKEQKH